MKNMKLRLMTAALLALAGMALTSSANAATTINVGDLILGIEDQNGVVTNDYEVDLGNIQTFQNASSALTFNLGADLTTAFGATWNQDNTGTGGTNVAWGIAGTSGNTGGAGFGANVLFFTNPEATPGTLNAAFNSKTNQGTIRSAISSMETGPTQSGFSGQSANGAVFADATIVAAGGLNSWTTRNAGSGFGFGSDIRNDFSGNLTGSGLTGTANSVSDLNVLLGGNTNPGTVLGTFQFNDSGVLTYTPQAVPEPSTYALMGLGALVLCWQMRRRASFNI